MHWAPRGIVDRNARRAFIAIVILVPALITVWLLQHPEVVARWT